MKLIRLASKVSAHSMSKWSKPRKLGWSLLLTSVFVVGTVYYVDSIKQLPIILRSLAILLLSYLQLRLGYFVEYLNEQNKRRLLTVKHKRLEEKANSKAKDLSELRDVIVSFLEHSEVYRAKIKDHLGFGEDYLCIAKSSEGLSKVFDAIGGGVQLPFTKVLHDLPGSIKPLETMDMFLIPLRNLPKIRGRHLKEYIEDVIIPKVKRKRIRFLNEVPAQAASLADEFSYKYLAFVINRNNIAHNVRNRKFNRLFTLFIVNEHIANDFKDLKADLVQVVKGKDLFELIDWASFADLSSQQRELISYYKQGINDALSESGVKTLSDLTKIEPEEFRDILWPVVFRKSTLRKVLNLSEKALEGARNTVNILRRNGVNF